VIYQVFAIFDSKVQVFSPPQFARTTGEMVRTVCDTLASGESMLSRHPEDFALYDLGQYDDATAAFELKPPASLGLLVQYMPQPKGMPLFDGLKKEGV